VGHSIPIDSNVHSMSFVLWDPVFGADAKWDRGRHLWSSGCDRSGANLCPVIELILRSNVGSFLDVNLDGNLRSGLVDVNGEGLEPKIGLLCRDVEHVALGLVVALVETCPEDEGW